MIDVFETWRQHDMGEVFVSHFDNALGMQLGMPSSICVHALQCGDNLVIEHNGDAYSCDHFVYPEFKLGNVRERDYPDLIETPIQQQFSLRKPMGSQLHCQGCSQRHLCHGACPAQRIDDNGELSLTAKHYLCAGYFAFFSHIQPYLRAMGECLRRQLPASAYRQFLRQSEQ
ncbi:SPASM domain-containing protein [Vibrio vulnificus]|uniref:SPASM domain-containing protein n=1 Tax=Vibrio vulnificus TaxID=672 RepID=UPI0021D13083|nr:SPASM domain-containing protein [Vibrio vulnificus]